jgi:hypothetical protein
MSGLSDLQLSGRSPLHNNMATNKTFIHCHVTVPLQAFCWNSVLQKPSYYGTHTVFYLLISISCVYCGCDDQRCYVIDIGFVTVPLLSVLDFCASSLCSRPELRPQTDRHMSKIVSCLLLVLRLLYLCDGRVRWANT